MTITQQPSIIKNSKSLMPFLKWAGGKRWFIPFLMQNLPTKYNRYLEPFLGGGAIFFCLQPENAVLADVNSRLIETYSAIRDDWQKITSHLKEYQERHNSDFYYAERLREYRGEYKRAAQFLYFNRVCWNGLYRVNLKGKFNVPLGTKNTIFSPADDFKSISKLLENKKILTSDFEPIIDRSERNDFIFIDPPYVTSHNSNGFAKYNENIFSWSDQERLQAAIQRATKRGVRILLTNADHESIRKLYSGIAHIQSIERNSIIAGKSNYRHKVAELVIKTY